MNMINGTSTNSAFLICIRLPRKKKNDMYKAPLGKKKKKKKRDMYKAQLCSEVTTK